MMILLDESVHLGVADRLRRSGHEVVSIVETGRSGATDDEVWELACSGPRLLITRDRHFSRAARFDPSECLGIIFLRPGNLRAVDEIALIERFLQLCPAERYQGRLVTLSPHELRIR